MGMNKNNVRLRFTRAVKLIKHASISCKSEDLCDEKAKLICGSREFSTETINLSFSGYNNNVRFATTGKLLPKGYIDNFI